MSEIDPNHLSTCTRSRAKLAVRLVATVGLYLVSGKFGLMTALPPGFATAIWPASGVALAAAIFWGPRIWPGVWVGAFLVNIGPLILQGTTTTFSVLTAVGIASGSTLEALFGVFLVSRFIGRSNPFERGSHVLKFLGAEILACMAGATFGVSCLTWAKVIPLDYAFTNWVTWYLGDLVGTILIAPVPFVWKLSPGICWNLRRGGETFLLLLLVLITSQLSFGTPFSVNLSYPLTYIFLVLVAWVAIRFSSHGVITLTLITSILAVWGTLKGHGVFGNIPRQESLLLWQSFAGILCVTGLTLAAVLREREQVTRELDHSHKETQAIAHELARSNESLEHFASMASHDLREPLRTLTMYLELTAKQLGKLSTPQAGEYLQEALSGAKRMKRLIDDLLNFSRVEAEKLSVEELVCKDIIETARENLKLAILENHATIILKNIPHTIKGNFGQLTELFQNLLSNAIKYHGENPPEICIACEKREREWLFSISDKGIGFEPQFAEHIFKVFKRLHSQSAYQGTGIGLALCKRVIEKHGGEIWAESQPGKGATFYFSLPENPADSPG